MPKSAPQISHPATKPAIILVHGFRGAPLGLEAIAEDLRAAGYQVFVPAVPPYAGAGELEKYDLESYANFLREFIDEHKLQKPILIGHSMGSVVASALASHRPELVHKKIIFLSPISAKPPRIFAPISPLAELLPAKTVGYSTTKFLSAAHDRQTLKDALALTYACATDQPPQKSAALAATKFAAHSSIQDCLPRGKDVLLIAGTKDRLISKKQTEKLAETLHAELKFIPGTGHIHNYEKPHETAQIILDFLA